MAGSLDRKTILAAFEALSERLRRKGFRAHIYIVGGAAMALTHRRSQGTFDVDALIVEESGSVMAAAREVAGELGLPRTWLKDHVRTLPFMPPQPDRRAGVVFESPSLVVTGASAAHMLAMKVHAARDKDLDDIATLIESLGLQTMPAVLEIHDAVFPHHKASARSLERVRNLVERQAQRVGEGSGDE